MNKKVRMRKIYVLSVKRIKKLKSLKYHIFAVKHYLFLGVIANMEVKMIKYLRKKNLLKY